MINECFLDSGFTGSYKAKTRLKNNLLALIKKHEREVIEEAIKIIKITSSESFYTNIPTNAIMPFHEYLQDRIEKLAKLNDLSGPKEVEK